jgi:hypothetical protein
MRKIKEWIMNKFRIDADGVHLCNFEALIHKFNIPYQTDYLEVYGYQGQQELMLAVFRINITEEYLDLWCRPEDTDYSVRLQLNGEPYEEEKDITACIHILFHK